MMPRSTDTSLPTILVSQDDYDRLEALLESSAAAHRDPELLEQLATELERSEVVAPDRLPAGVVRMHSRVAFRDLETGDTREYQLVYPREADATNGRLSVLAPVGCALLGLSEGQEIAWPLPDGRTRKLRVIAVSTPPPT